MYVKPVCVPYVHIRPIWDVCVGNPRLTPERRRRLVTYDSAIKVTG